MNSVIIFIDIMYIFIYFIPLVNGALELLYNAPFECNYY